MPYPNEHSCRLVDPGQCKDGSFRRETGGGQYNGKAYDIIWAETKRDDQTVRQANRYPTSRWSEAQARDHCNSQDSIKFEPASGQTATYPQILAQTWAITEAGLEQVQDAADQVGAVQAIMAKMGDRPRDTELTQIRDGVAVIEVIGPIFHYENILTWIFGLPSAEGVMQELQAALENPQVKSIILQIDSPGGQVGGINELSDFIRMQKDKPIYAYVGGMAASAGYWIASAADQIVTANTAELGSIGVVFSMRRRSDNSLEIVSTASPKKRPDPETDEGRRQIQDRADAIAEVFIEAVQQNRILTREQVVSLQGDVAIASRAIEMGLADRIGTLEGLIAEMQDKKSYTGVNAMTLTFDQLKSEHSTLYEQAKEEGRAEVRQEVDTAKAQGNKEAQDHVVALVEAVLGADAKGVLDQVMQAGLTADQVTTAKGIFGTQQPQGGQADPTQQQILEGLEAATPPPAPAATETQETEGQQFETLVNEHQKQNQCKRSESIGAIAASHPKLHEAWINDKNKK
jgi:ClpP class serine protease